MSTVVHIYSGSPLVELQLGLGDTYSALTDTVEELNSIYRDLDRVPKLNANLRDAGASLVFRRNQDQDLGHVVETNKQKLSDFLDHTRQTDLRVCGYIGRSQEKLFRAYPHLRPVETEEKSWWEKLVDDLSELCGKAKDALFTAGKAVWEWAKDHAVELVVGAVAIVVGAAIAVFTAGTGAVFIGALLTGLKVAVVSALSAGVSNAAIALFTGEDMGKAFGDGIANGFMWGGIGFLGSKMVTAGRVLKNTKPTKLKAGQKYNPLRTKRQVHHFMTDKGQGKKGMIKLLRENIAGFEDYTDDMLLEVLDGDWNKMSIRHSGRHGSGYHTYIKENVQKILQVNGKVRTPKLTLDEFGKAFKKVELRLAANPDMLYSKYWKMSDSVRALFGKSDLIASGVGAGAGVIQAQVTK